LLSSFKHFPKGRKSKYLNPKQESMVLEVKRYRTNGTFFYCPVDLTLSVIGGRWKGLVFWNLKEGPKRFSEIKKSLFNINDKMLAQVLKELESNGVIQKNTIPESPSKFLYSITENGMQLMPVMKQMHQWGSAFEI
jgi:DNA-binding HxlR family transcriptional regulator